MPSFFFSFLVLYRFYLSQADEWQLTLAEGADSEFYLKQHVYGASCKMGLLSQKGESNFTSRTDSINPSAVPTRTGGPHSFGDNTSFAMVRFCLFLQNLVLLPGWTQKNSTCKTQHCSPAAASPPHSGACILDGHEGCPTISPTVGNPISARLSLAFSFPSCS